MCIMGVYFTVNARVVENIFLKHYDNMILSHYYNTEYKNPLSIVIIP